MITLEQLKAGIARFEDEAGHDLSQFKAWTERNWHALVAKVEGTPPGKEDENTAGGETQVIGASDVGDVGSVLGGVSAQAQDTVSGSHSIEPGTGALGAEGH